MCENKISGKIFTTQQNSLSRHERSSMEASNRTGGIISFICNQIEDKKFGHNDTQKY